MLYCCLFNSGLLSVILFNCFYSQPDLSALLKRVEALETQSRPDISTHMRQLSSYGLRSEADFDKYHAVTLAEAAAVEAHRAADPKAYFLDAACQTLRSSLSRPTDRFKAYFLALFSDKDYTKILDSIAKVDWELSDAFRPLEVVTRTSTKWVTHIGTSVNGTQGMAAGNTHILPDFVRDVALGNQLADVTMLSFRDPNSFFAGNLHNHLDFWRSLAALSPYDQATTVLNWIENRVNVFDFFQHFKGHYKGMFFDSDIPPPMIFKNAISCKMHTRFIHDTILDRLATGAISIADVMAHIGWSAPATAQYYLKLSNVIRAGAPPDLLSQESPGSSLVFEKYTDFNHLKNFVLAFPAATTTPTH